MLEKVREWGEKVERAQGQLNAARLALGRRLIAGADAAQERQDFQLAETALRDAEAGLMAAKLVAPAAVVAEEPPVDIAAKREMEREVVAMIGRFRDDVPRLPELTRIDRAAELLLAARLSGSGTAQRAADAAIKACGVHLRSVQMRAEQRRTHAA